jgi:uncharacterized SAM-binding protein YcdF (DUF218 family)
MLYKGSNMPQQGEKRSGCILKSSCIALGGTASFILSLVIALLIIELTLTALGAMLIIADPIHKADAAVVLSGGGMGRLEEAAKLYEEKYISWIILTETGESSPDFGLYSEIDRIEMVRLGVPPSQIIITEQPVNDTDEEARIVRKLAQSRGIMSLLIVTDPFHSLRTRLIFREEFRGSDIKVDIRPVRGHWYRSSTWWTNRMGWEATINEYLRLFYYFVKAPLQ